LEYMYHELKWCNKPNVILVFTYAFALFISDYSVGILRRLLMLSGADSMTDACFPWQL